MNIGSLQHGTLVQNSTVQYSTMGQYLVLSQYSSPKSLSFPMEGRGEMVKKSSFKAKISPQILYFQKKTYMNIISVSSPEKCVDHGSDLSPACLGCDVAVADGGDDGDAVQEGPGHAPLRGLLEHRVRTRLPPVVTFVLHLQGILDREL